MERLSAKWQDAIRNTSDEYVPKGGLNPLGIMVKSQIGSFNGSCIAACGDLAIFAAKHCKEYDVKRMDLIVTLLNTDHPVPLGKSPRDGKDVSADAETFFWDGNLDNFGNDYILFVFIAFEFSFFSFIEKSWHLLFEFVTRRRRSSAAVSIKFFN
jgi:hypothetical protein